MAEHMEMHLQNRQAPYVPSAVLRLFLVDQLVHSQALIKVAAHLVGVWSISGSTPAALLLPNEFSPSIKLGEETLELEYHQWSGSFAVKLTLVVVFGMK